MIGSFMYILHLHFSSISTIIVNFDFLKKKKKMWGSLLWYLVQFLPFCISYLQVVSSSSSLNSSFQSGKLCSSEDSFALLHFKNTISINTSASSHCDNYAVSYPKTYSWKQGSDCCSWSGVTCDRFTGHVTALDLSSSQLLGNIEVNSSLFLLHHLRKLNLACNDFQGSRISSKFGQFTYLTHLNLSSSSFSGLVPTEISQLSKLLSADLSNNSLKLEQPNFVKFLQNVTELRDLVLDFVDMSLVIPGSLANLSSSLISLSLRHNNIQGEFPNEVLHLPFLQKLILSENTGLTGTFPVSNWSSPLRLFNLSFTSFSGKLPDTIGNLLNLNVLDLASCKFEGPIPTSFWNLTRITSLVLTSNHFTGQIPTSLSNLVRLTDLYLRHNNFSGQFPDVFRNLSKVKYLDLSENNFTDQLPLSAFNLTQLSSLDFSDNQFVGQFPSHVSGLSYLTKLRLFTNLLNGTIPPWLFTLPSLEILGLGNNNFTGSLDQSQALAGSLKYFLLGQNEIQGPIPNSIFTLVNLTFLDLSSNNLSGVLNIDMFSKLKNLKKFYLSGNNLLSLGSDNNVNFRLPKLEDFRCSSCNITEFPSFLKASENLKFLDLSNNSIPGQISQSESALWHSLLHLDLSDNKLTSFEQIPSVSLEHLDLHSNFLEGSLVPLPPSMRFVSVGNNKLAGEIPSSFCNFNSIGYIDLSNNSLTGMIPQCLASYDELSVLDLRMNNFYGSIPQTFSMSYRLTSLNLNGNQLEGTLPPSLANCSSLQVLDVGNNRIEDSFPHWLAALPDLLILILKSNRFYGPIDDSKTRFPFPNLRILDISDNLFTGLLPTTYFENFQAMMQGDDVGYNNVVEYLDDGNYRDSATVTIRGREEIMFVIISNFLTTIDLSNNQFRGQIPAAVGNLNRLRFLNFSHNNLNGNIPSMFGNLTVLESLDLSSNKLDGEIPLQIVNLVGLAFLNLSHNRLVGPIPHGAQFNTFANDSYIGNFGLCGIPLSINCSNNGENTSGWFDWKIIMMGYGSGIVIGLSIGYIVFTTGKPWWFVSMVERKVIKLTGSRRRRRN